MKPLPKSFFNKPTNEIARSLLGKYIVKGKMVAKIIETESYLFDDPASHSFKGKTPRNASMFDHPATSYVYFIYGMYHCFNITTNKKGIGEAVLIRAVEPVKGVEEMKNNREVKEKKSLTNGPAKLTIAFRINRTHNNLNLLNKNSKIKLMQPEKEEKFKIEKAKRIGISKGKNALQRFYIKDNNFVSRK